MYALAVMQSISNSTTIKNIDKTILILLQARQLLVSQQSSQDLHFHHHRRNPFLCYKQGNLLKGVDKKTGRREGIEPI